MIWSDAKGRRTSTNKAPKKVVKTRTGTALLVSDNRICRIVLSGNRVIMWNVKKSSAVGIHS